MAYVSECYGCGGQMVEASRRIIEDEEGRWYHLRMDCPRCKTRLTMIPLTMDEEDVPLHPTVCGECEGEVWSDPDGLPDYLCKECRNEKLPSYHR